MIFLSEGFFWELARGREFVNHCVLHNIFRPRQSTKIYYIHTADATLEGSSEKIVLTPNVLGSVISGRTCLVVLCYKTPAACLQCSLYNKLNIVYFSVQEPCNL